jgi:plasmid stability protein
MATITVRNLDDTVIERLKQRAAEHSRSMEEEARDILRRQVETDWDAIRARLKARQESWRREGRIFSDSVEIIREMREERAAQIDAAIKGR